MRILRKFGLYNVDFPGFHPLPFYDFNDFYDFYDFFTTTTPNIRYIRAFPTYRAPGRQPLPSPSEAESHPIMGKNDHFSQEMRLLPPFFTFCALFRLSCRASSPLPRRRRERGSIICQLASLWFTIIQFTLCVASSPSPPRFTHGASRNGARMRPYCVFLSTLILQGESAKTAYKRHFKPNLTSCRIFSPAAEKMHGRQLPAMARDCIYTAFLPCSPYRNTFRRLYSPMALYTAFFRFRRRDLPRRASLPRFQKDDKKRERLFTALPLTCQSLCICSLSLSLFGFQV